METVRSTNAMLVAVCLVCTNGCSSLTFMRTPQLVEAPHLAGAPPQAVRPCRNTWLWPILELGLGVAPQEQQPMRSWPSPSQTIPGHQRTSR